jgi:hypothetical protein
MKRRHLATGLNGPPRAAGEQLECRSPGGELVKHWFSACSAMANLNRRVKKLEAIMTDDAGLVPSSPRWWAYWNEQLHRYIARDPVVKVCKVPLVGLRAYIQSADPDMIEGHVES